MYHCRLLRTGHRINFSPSWRTTKTQFQTPSLWKSHTSAIQGGRLPNLDPGGKCKPALLDTCQQNPTPDHPIFQMKKRKKMLPTRSDRCSTCHLVLKTTTYHDCPGAPMCTEPGCDGRVFKSRASYHTHVSRYHRGKARPSTRVSCQECSWHGWSQDLLDDHIAKEPH